MSENTEGTATPDAIIGGIRVGDVEGNVSVHAVGDIVGGNKETHLTIERVTVQIQVAPKALTQAPYKFLAYYDVSDRDIFFGRENTLKELAALASRHKVVIISGQAGVGKSSLVNAGLIPRLESGGYLYARFRDYTDPLAQLREYFLHIETHSRDQPEAAALSLLLEAASSTPKTRLAVIFDQFERFFVSVSEDARHAFIDDLRISLSRGAAADASLIFIIRQDFLGQMLAEFEAAITDFATVSRRYYLQPLNSLEAREAIIEPLKLVEERIVYDIAFVDHVLLPHLIGQSPGLDRIEPPHLQIVCNRLYECARERNAKDGQGIINEVLYNELGTAAGILRDYLDVAVKQVAEADLGQVGVARSILKLLIHSSGTRKFVPIEELQFRLPDVSRQQLSLLLDKLHEARVIETRESNRVITFSLSHEVMVPTVLDWLDEREVHRKRAEDILDRGVHENKDTNTLLNENQVSRVRRWLNRELSPAEDSLLRLSEAANETSKREKQLYAEKAIFLRRVVQWIVVVATFAIIGSLAWSLASRKRATNALSEYERLADSRRLTDALSEADQLWPAVPSMLDKLQHWNAKYNDLFGRLPSHQAELAIIRKSADTYADEQRRNDFRSEYEEMKRWNKQIESLNAKIQHETDSTKVAELQSSLETASRKMSDLKATVSGQRTWYFRGDSQLQFRHDQLMQLVTALRQAQDPKIGVVASVTNRIKVCETIYGATIGDRSAEWAAAIDRVQRNTKYKGLRLQPQIGLIPLGPDPKSSLEEFLHWPTHEGEVPVRDVTGHFHVQPGTGLIFILIPEGNFYMGAQKDDPRVPNFDPGARSNESPVRQVFLSAYFISKYEMTQGQWLRFTGNNPSFYGPGFNRPDMKAVVNLTHPIELVSWDECDTVARQLGLGLPSEAQWERAARADGNTVYTGTSDVTQITHFANVSGAESQEIWPSDQPGYIRPYRDDFIVHAPVGSLEANAFGLYDTTGNVDEWCEDRYADYAVDPMAGNGLRESVETARVDRGGDFAVDATLCRIACRNKIEASYKDYFLGLRPIRSIDQN